MGYNTIFKGELKFTKELTNPELCYLNSIFGEDCRDHPEWNEQIKNISDKNLSYVHLILLKDFSGIKWDDRTKKTYNLIEVVQLVINLMNAKFYHDFGLNGKLLAQGEDIEDRWYLICENKKVKEEKIMETGLIIKCPHCESSFRIKERNDEK